MHVSPLKITMGNKFFDSQDYSIQPGTLVRELTARFSITPQNKAVFIQAFTHSSYTNEHGIPSNERLEFLGDSVLSLIVSRFLYEQLPGSPEGMLSKYKSIIVSSEYWYRFSNELGLNQLLLLGEGEKRSRGFLKKNVLADLFEAFIGAYFINFGLDQTTSFVLPLLQKVLPEIIKQANWIDAKTHLQELATSLGFVPEYRLIKESGPDHSKIFTVEVLCEGKPIGKGEGSSLKEAQRQAAIHALGSLQESNKI